LEDSPPEKYYLSKAACQGILRRAKAKGKTLQTMLEQALIKQAG
jgi:DNA (cytosine-5)-methyltransferase 1